MDTSTSNPPRAFRFQAIRAMLTYSCPINMADNPIQSIDELLEHLMSLPDVSGCVVGAELHESGKRHYHAFLKFDHRVNIRNARHFDFKGVHPNIGHSGTDATMVAYVTKHGDYKSVNVNVEDLLAKAKPKIKTKDAYSAAAKLAAEGKLEDAKAVILEHDPQGYLSRHENIDSGLEKVYSRGQAAMRPVTFKMTWTHPVKDVDVNATIRQKNENGDEFGDPYVPCHLLVGQAGIGKTELARYLLHKAGCKHVVVITDIEDLKSMGAYDGVVFDEASFNVMVTTSGVTDAKTPREQQIALLDTAYDRSIKARYANVVLKSHIRRVFTTNFLDRAFNVADAAIARRCIVHELGTEPLFQ